MNKIKDYVDKVFKALPDCEENDLLKQEIIENLEEKVEDLIQEGKAEEDAINKAIVDFGDIEDIKKEFQIQNPQKKDLSKINLYFSLMASALIISLFVFINLYYSPKTIWFVYPAFGVLWWPLSMLFKWMRELEKKREK